MVRKGWSAFPIPSVRVVQRCAWKKSTIHAVGHVVSHGGPNGVALLSGRLSQRSRLLRSAGGSDGMFVQGNPDVVQAASRSLVERLERAVAVFGEGDSAEIRGLQAALKEARRAAQNLPLAAQVEECPAFIQCSQRRLQRLQEERWSAWQGSERR